jgi:hypothetical protein
VTPDTLLTELQTRGIKIRRDGDRLLVTDQSKALTPGLSAAIKKHKAALLDRLPVIPHEQLPLAVPTSPTGTAQRAGLDSPPARPIATMQPGAVRTWRGDKQTLSDAEIDQTLATGAPIGLAVLEWPADPAQRARLARFLEDSRCAEFYAADRALCDALDREDEAAIVAASQRFAAAHQAARLLAREIEPEKT